MTGNLADWATVQGSVPLLHRPTEEEFTAALGKPFVLTGVLEIDSPDAWMPESIKREVGDRKVGAYISADGTFPGGVGPNDESKYRIVELTVRECVDRMLGSVAEPIFSVDEKCYLYQVRPEKFGSLLARVPDPGYLARRQNLSKNVWISGRGNITPIHYDTGDNLLAQMTGRKTVLVWDPSQYELLYLNPLGTAQDRQSRINVYSREERFSNFDRARAFRHELMPGEILHIPSTWPHYVYTREFSVSVNYWFDYQDLVDFYNDLVAAGTDKSKLDDAVERALQAFAQSRPEMTTLLKCLVKDNSLNNVVRDLNSA